jgi:hypothetical protein
MSAAELAKVKADQGYVYLEFKSDGSCALGVDSFDPLGRTALRRDFPPIPFKFRAVGTSQIEFSDVPRGAALQRFGPFVRGTQSTVRINDDTLTLSSTTTTKLLRVVLN